MNEDISNKTNSPYRNNIIAMVLFLFAFGLYFNTINHEYTLDDAIVVYENIYVLEGIEGIPEIFSEELFNGFYNEKNKNLVAGGRYRPLSLVSYAVEYEFIMGSPFNSIDLEKFKDKLNQNAPKDFILPSRKLHKNLIKTLLISDSAKRIEQQKKLMEQSDISEQNTVIILGNMDHMSNKLKWHQRISHLINVLLYALTAVIVFFVLLNLFKDYKNKIWFLSIPFLASLLFVAHPLHTEVVANIKGRDEILAFLFSMLSLLFVLKFIDTKRAYWIIMIFFSFLLAMFSKETSVTFLAIIPLAIWFFRKAKIKTYISVFVTILVPVIIYFVIRSGFVNGIESIGEHESTEIMNNSFYGMDFFTKYATIFYSLFLYIKLLIFPHPLTYDYYPYYIEPQGWTLLPLLSLGFYTLLAGFAVRGFFKRNKIAFGILFFAACLGPTSNLLFSIGAFMNERFVYMASFGFVLVVAMIIQQALKIAQFKKSAVWVVSVLLFISIGLMSFKTIDRNKAWKNDFILFTTDVETSFNSAKSTCSVGGKYFELAIDEENKDLQIEYAEKSRFYLKQALKIHPAYTDALILMGNIQFVLHEDIDSASYYYEMLLSLNPNNQMVRNNLFVSDMTKVFEDPSQTNTNLKALNRLLPYMANDWQPYFYLGRIYGKFLGNLQQSQYYLEKANELNSNEYLVLFGLGVVYGIQNRFQESYEVLYRAYQIDDTDINLVLNLASSYLNGGQKEKSMIYFDKILEMELKAENSEQLIILEEIFKQIGDLEREQMARVKFQQLENSR